MTPHVPPAAPTVTPELVQRLDRAGPRYTSYPTADRFTPAFDAAAYHDVLARVDAAPDGPLSVYMHMPHCTLVCTYCACTMIGTKREDKRSSYVDLLSREVALVAERLPHRGVLGQLHFGGGTPNSYRLEDLERIVKQVTRRFVPTPDAELAIEVDPRLASPDQIRALRGIGLNRISFGVQDFNVEVQEAIGRMQDVAQTAMVIDSARAAGFASVNTDLVYGLPAQTEERFDETLDNLLALRPDRVALFSFAYVPWVKKAQRAIDASLLPPADAKLRMLCRARERLIGAGWTAIGMDHFALPGDALADAPGTERLRRTFQGYTVAPSGAPSEVETLGFGLSAIGDLGVAYAQNVKEIRPYTERLQAGELPIERGWALDPDDRARRDLIQQVMTRFAVDASAFSAAWGLDFNRAYAVELERLAPLAAEGLLVVDPSGFRLTPLGELFPRLVAMAFDRHLHERPPERPAYSRVV